MYSGLLSMAALSSRTMFRRVPRTLYVLRRRRMALYGSVIKSLPMSLRKWKWQTVPGTAGKTCATLDFRMAVKRRKRRPCAGGKQVERRVRKLPPNRVAKRAAGFHLLNRRHTPAKLVRNNIGIKIKLAGGTPRPQTPAQSRRKASGRLPSPQPAAHPRKVPQP